jgi:hypothetical protein
MLASPLTVLSIIYPPAVYVNIPGYLMLKTVRGDVNINC